MNVGYMTTHEDNNACVYSIEVYTKKVHEVNNIPGLQFN